MSRIKADELPEVDLAAGLDSQEEITAFLDDAAKDSNPEVFARALGYVLENYRDDGAAAKAHLAAGRPIYYWNDELQGMIRKWPDGRRELVEYDDAGQLIVVRLLS